MEGGRIMKLVSRKIYWFVAVSILILGIVGCGNPTTRSDSGLNTKYPEEQQRQQENKGNQGPTSDSEEYSEEYSEDDASPVMPLSEQSEPSPSTKDNDNNQPTAQDEKTSGTITQPSIVFKSENPITISSKEVLEQLDKELEQLLQSLDSMDEIVDEQLNF